MRPRVRSYGESSTSTLSPGRMRMKFLRIFPDTCARTLCLLCSSTRNIAFGSGSTTVASTWIASSLDIGGPIPSRRAQRAEHARSRIGERHAALEVRGEAAVACAGGPAVGVEHDLGASGV